MQAAHTARLVKVLAGIEISSETICGHQLLSKFVSCCCDVHTCEHELFNNS